MVIDLSDLCGFLGALCGKEELEPLRSRRGTAEDAEKILVRSEKLDRYELLERRAGKWDNKTNKLSVASAKARL